VLKVDASQLLVQLNNLFQEGQDMAVQSVIDSNAYDTWFEKVKASNHEP
jgi:hypothetical protein